MFLKNKITMPAPKYSFSYHSGNIEFLFKYLSYDLQKKTIFGFKITLAFV